MRLNQILDHPFVKESPELGRDPCIYWVCTVPDDMEPGVFHSEEKTCPFGTFIPDNLKFGQPHYNPCVGQGTHIQCSKPCEYANSQ